MQSANVAKLPPLFSLNWVLFYVDVVRSCLFLNNNSTDGGGLHECMNVCTYVVSCNEWVNEQGHRVITSSSILVLLRQIYILNCSWGIPSFLSPFFVFWQLSLLLLRSGGALRKLLFCRSIDDGMDANNAECEGKCGRGELTKKEENEFPN